MSTTTDLSTLKINYLTKSQYDTAKAQGLIESNEIYMTPEDSLLRSKVGAIVAYAGSDEPQGWLKCDGRAVSRIDYAELYEVIGTTFGSGDGSTTFNIPDLRGRVATGVGTLSGNTYTLGDDVDAGLPNITGSLYQRSTNYNVSNITWTGGGALAVSDDTSGWTADSLSQINGAVARKKIDLNASNSNSIYGNSTTVQPNTLALNFLICYENHSIGGSGSGGPVDSTDVPTETKIAEFDSNAHMNSTDMTTKDVNDFVDALEVQSSLTLIKTVKYNDEQITWYSTSQPFAEVTTDITLDGWTPIDLTYQITESGSTFVYPSYLGITKSGDGTKDYAHGVFRMVINSPSSTTQNKVNWTVTYIKNAPMVTPMADYIVEQGTSGIWTFRKWESGIAECWGTTRFTDVPMTSAWGYGYYATSVGRSISLPPSFFISVSAVSVGTDFHGGTGNWNMEGIGTSSIGGYLWSTKSETRNAIDVSLEVKGWWK